MKENTDVKFVARHAILDRDENVFAYELLYRNSKKNYFPTEVSDDKATARLFFDTLLFFGIDKLVNDKKAFINLSTTTILSDIPKLIDPANVILEIIERTEQLDAIFPIVTNLMANGYVFALDDYDSNIKWEKLLAKVAFVKLEVEPDIQDTVNTINKLKSRYPDKKIIVERIEDYKSFEIIKNAGADYFQGYYFTKPNIVNYKNVNPSQLIILDLLKIAMKSPLDFKLLIKKIENDAGLVSRILKLSNLACKTSKKEISSISQAVIYLGEDTIKRFVTVLTLGELGGNKPSELLKLGLIRAKFISELLINEDKEISQTGYLLGLISILDALLDVEPATIFKEFPLSQEIQEALEKQSGQLGLMLAMCLSIEKNDVVGIGISQNTLNLTEEQVTHAYANSLIYADEVFQNVN
ncbi:EAL and HDOD domain-containing protein [Thalassotalea agariperforans]